VTHGRKAKAGPALSIDYRFARFALRIRRSRRHGFGVFATESIPRGRKVIEYTGERISLRQNMPRYKKTWGPGGSKVGYVFMLDWNHFVDASSGGSGAERVNHCCEPNLAVRRIRGHILFFSRRRIRKGEELTLDYRLRPNPDPIPCRCGAAQCRGTINYPLSGA